MTKQKTAKRRAAAKPAGKPAAKPRKRSAKNPKCNPLPAAGLISPAAKAQVARFLRSVAAGYAGAKAAAKKSFGESIKKNPDSGKKSWLRKFSARRGLLIKQGYSPAEATRKTLEHFEQKLIPGKKNPLHASRKARKTYAMFHGRAPRKTTLAKTKARIPGKDFAKIGDLVSLTVGNRKVSFEDDKVQPIVVTDAKAKKLFFLGGNQDLRALKPARRANPGGLQDLGEVSQIEYYARKKFDDFRPTIYFHNLGEENGKRPRLMFDPVARQMYLAGGDYKIENVGIVN